MENNLSNSIAFTLSKWGFTKEGIKNNKRGEWWLISQLLIIFAHLITPPPFLRIGSSSLVFKEIGVCIFITGLFIAIWAFVSIGSNLIFNHE